VSNHKIHTLNNTTPVRVSPRPLHSGADITVQNLDSSAFVYVGVNDTLSTTSYGFKILPNSAISFELSGRDSIFLIGSTSSVQAAVLTIGLEEGN
jgi:hypothetical protein